MTLLFNLETNNDDIQSKGDKIYNLIQFFIKNEQVIQDILKSLQKNQDIDEKDYTQSLSSLISLKTIQLSTEKEEMPIYEICFFKNNYDLDNEDS